MTYNVHGFVGTDGKYDPARVARVITQSEPDLVALQEVELGPQRRGAGVTIEWFAEQLGMQCHFTLTRQGHHGGQFGNAVLTRHSFELVSEGSLPARGGESRAVQWLKVRTPQHDFHLMNTHLSTRFFERRLQVKALLGAEWLVRAGSDLPLVICGDFNTTPLSPVYRHLSRDLVDAQRTRLRRRATWPSAWPLICLDYLFLSQDFRVNACRVTRSPLTRVASDHLPIEAEVELKGPARVPALD
jgi:endonuclease/exonuclease/phosphatase family metal-dependent hydrolase